jgi:hypothetical protein
MQEPDRPIGQKHEEKMRVTIIAVTAAAGAAMLFGSAAFSQECLRPEWTACVAFPNGGSHTGVSIERMQVKIDVPPGPDICVVNHEEISGYTYARFQRNGTPWPNEDWGVDIDTFCFYKN